MLIHGNAARLALADGTVHVCVTSPAYYRARKYDCKAWWSPVTFRPDPHLSEEWRVGEWYGELGWEPHVLDFIGHLVAVFREVKRALHKTGSLWVNIGDKRTAGRQWHGVPDLLCRALIADGWRWEDLVLWHKPSAMPGSQANRFTRDFEHIFVFNLSKDDVFFDVDGAREEHLTPVHLRTDRPETSRYKIGIDSSGKTIQVGGSGFTRNRHHPAGRTRRTTWSINPQGYDGAHYATWPLELVMIMLKAATSARGCCDRCGRPWRRVTEKGLTAHDGDTSTDYEQGSNANRLALLRQAARERGEEYSSARQTIAWHPQCTCYGTPTRGPVRCARCKGTGRERRYESAGGYSADAGRNDPANPGGGIMNYVPPETGAPCPYCDGGWTEGDVWPDDVDTWPVAPSVVLDPFAGSGTTGLACRQLTLAGHPLQFVGVDLQGKYLVEQALPRAEGKTATRALAELPLFAAAS